MTGVTYDGAEPPPLAAGYEPLPKLVGWSGSPLLGLMGHRGPYVPRVPVLFGQIVPLHQTLPKATPQQRAEVWRGGPGDPEDDTQAPDAGDAPPDTLRSPPSSLPPSREPVPVTEASGTGLSSGPRRPYGSGPEPRKCVVCTRSYRSTNPAQRTCDRRCGGVVRSNAWRSLQMTGTK